MMPAASPWQAPRARVFAVRSQDPELELTPLQTSPGLCLCTNQRKRSTARRPPLWEAVQSLVRSFQRTVLRAVHFFLHCGMESHKQFGQSARKRVVRVCVCVSVHVCVPVSVYLTLVVTSPHFRFSFYGARTHLSAQA